MEGASRGAEVLTTPESQMGVLLGWASTTMRAALCTAGAGRRAAEAGGVQEKWGSKLSRPRTGGGRYSRRGLVGAGAGGAGCGAGCCPAGPHVAMRPSCLGTPAQGKPGKASIRLTAPPPTREGVFEAHAHGGGPEAALIPPPALVQVTETASCFTVLRQGSPKNPVEEGTEQLAFPRHRPSTAVVEFAALQAPLAQPAAQEPVGVPKLAKETAEIVVPLGHPRSRTAFSGEEPHGGEEGGGGVGEGEGEGEGQLQEMLHAP